MVGWSTLTTLSQNVFATRAGLASAVIEVRPAILRWQFLPQTLPEPLLFDLALYLIWFLCCDKSNYIS